MKMFQLLAGTYLVACVVLLFPRSLYAQENLKALNWQGVPVDIVLKKYSEITGRTLLVDPDVPKDARINLVSHTRLSDQEIRYALDSVLAMNGISVHEDGEKFLKVMPSAKFKPEATEIRVGAEDEGELPDSDKLVNQFIALKHITPAEAQAAISGLVHTIVNMMLFVRSNNCTLLAMVWTRPEIAA